MSNIKKDVKKVEKKLTGLLDLAPSVDKKETSELTIYNPQVPVTPEPKILPNFEDDFNSDYVTSRNTLLQLLKDTDRMIKQIMAFAEEGESARVYEVSGMLMKTRADITVQLMDLQEKTSTMRGNKNSGGFQPNSTMNVENAMIFQGTTQEVLEQIRKSKNT